MREHYSACPSECQARPRAVGSTSALSQSPGRVQARFSTGLRATRVSRGPPPVRTHRARGVAKTEPVPLPLICVHQCPSVVNPFPIFDCRLTIAPRLLRSSVFHLHSSSASICVNLRMPHSSSVCIRVHLRFVRSLSWRRDGSPQCRMPSEDDRGSEGSGDDKMADGEFHGLIPPPSILIPYPCSSVSICGIPISDSRLSISEWTETVSAFRLPRSDFCLPTSPPWRHGGSPRSLLAFLTSALRGLTPR